MTIDDVTYTVEVGTTVAYSPAGWTDVSSRLLGPESDFGRDLEVEYGRPDELSEEEAGTCTFLLENDDGNWDPGIAPTTPIRVKATLNSTTYDVAYGVVESAPAVWPGRALGRGQVDVRLADGLTLLARAEVGETTRPSELPGTRIGAILDLAGWPAGMRDIDTGQVYLDELGVYDADGVLQDVIVNALVAIREAVEAEQGQCYIDPNGNFVFHDRHSRLDNTATTEFGPSPDIEYDDLAPAYDDRFLWPTARAEQADGTVVEYTNDAAITAGYGGLSSSQPGRVYIVRDLPCSDIEARAVAAWIVTRYGTPDRRWEQLVLEAVKDAEVVAALTLRPGHLVRIQSTTPSIDENAHIESVEHRFTSGKLISTFGLSPYFGAGPWVRFDDATVGFDEGGFAP